MRIIARSTLTKFVATLPGGKQRSAVKGALDAWFHEVERSDWRSPAEVKRLYATASVTGRERVVFKRFGIAAEVLIRPVAKRKRAA